MIGDSRNRFQRQLEIHCEVVDNTNRVADLESNGDIPHFPINQYDQVCEVTWSSLRVLPGYSSTDDMSNIQHFCRNWDPSKDPPIFVCFPKPVHKRDLRDVLCRRWNRDKSTVSGFEYFTYNSYFHEISLLKTTMNLEAHLSAEAKQPAAGTKSKGGKMILEITSWPMFPEPHDLEVQYHFNSDWVGKNLHVRCALLIPSARGNQPHGIYSHLRQIPFPFEIHRIEVLKTIMSLPRIEPATHNDGSSPETAPALTSPRIKRSRSEVSSSTFDIEGDEQNRKRLVVAPIPNGSPPSSSSTSTVAAANPSLAPNIHSVHTPLIEGAFTATSGSPTFESMPPIAAADVEGSNAPSAAGVAPTKPFPDVELRFWDLGFSLSEDI